jgi:hypothetical protein
MKNIPHDLMLEQYEEAKELATELFGGIWEDAVMWMQLPNEAMFGSTPMSLIATGDGQTLIDWLKTRTNKKPGSAF